MKIGILGTADIAFRRFLPALKSCQGITYIGIASRTPEKTDRFLETYGGRAYSSYEALLEDPEIDAVYVPLPPALHYEWGKRVLLSGKHLMMEKPFTTSLKETQELLQLAKEKNLAVHENYMFLYHSQLAKVKEWITDGTLGEVRLFRMSFGFPKRADEDFRYCKALGGGALLDCGGYPVRLALELLGKSARVTQAKLNQPEGYEVDLFGNAVLENDNGLCAQISFGMDNAYQCQLEIWGSKATLIAQRFFTAPDGFLPQGKLLMSDKQEEFNFSADYTFLNSILEFERLMICEKNRNISYMNIWKQSKVISDIKRMNIYGKME